MCFNDIFFDREGKCWLRTCNNITESNLHLFQFDGYEFRLVQGDLNKLSNSSRIWGMRNNRELVGFESNPNNQMVFFYDLEKGQIKIVKVSDEGQIRQLCLNKNGELFVLTEEKDKYLIYRWLDDQFELRKELKAPYQFLDEKGFISSHIINFDDQYIWVLNKEQGQYFFQQIEIISGRIRQHSISEVPPKLDQVFSQKLYRIHGKLTRVDQATYLALKFLNTSNLLFKLDDQQKQFLHVTGSSGGTFRQHIFQDEKGNTIFLNINHNEKNTAVLRDIHGQLFDYSAFVNPRQGRNINNLISPDFTRQVWACSGRGFVLYKVKATHAIDRILPDNGIRAIAELTNEQYCYFC